MDDAEMTIEIAKLSHRIGELQQIAWPLSGELRPIEATIKEIRARIRETYEHRYRRNAEYGFDRKIYFKGKIKVVKSMRATLNKYLVDKNFRSGWRGLYRYAEVEKRILISDPGAIALRAPLFKQLTEISDKYGKRLALKNKYYQQIFEAEGRLERLSAARDKARQKSAKTGRKRG